MPNLPEIPLLDFVLALASAALMVAAAFYLVSGRASAPARVRVRLSPRAAGEAEREMFAETSPDVTGSRLSLVTSLFLHVLLVAAVPAIDLLNPPPLDFEMSDYDLMIVQYDADDPGLILPADLVPFTRPTDTPTPPQVAVLDREDPLGLPEQTEEQTRQAQGPGEGPVIEVMLAESEPETVPLIEVILGDDAPSLSPEPEPTPAVILWNREQQTADALAQIRPKRFEMDDLGTAGGSGASRVELAGLGVTPPPVVSPRPVLPVPWGVFSNLGQAGNGFAAYSGGGGANGFGIGGGGIEGASLAAAGGPSAGLMLQLGMQGGELARLFGSQGGAAYGGSGQDVDYRAGAAEGPETGGLGRGRLTPVPRALHGIILVSNSMGTLPEAAGVLSGNPVYTVYVEVPGAPRKWVLQFCVPRGQGGELEFAGGIVRVLSRKTLDPPYAVHREPLELRFVPTIERISQLPHRVIVHGNLDSEGVLRNARIIRGADPGTDETVLANLREWEFLPAFRDGEPVEVEAVFGIPLY